MAHRVAIIGLGVMGQRMLGSMHRYAGFQACVAWDPDAAARADTARHYPKLRVADSAEEAAGSDDTDVVYIACPPRHHETHAYAALAYGKHVWCEKPLGVDLAASERLARAARESGRVNLVNFSLASAVATAEIEILLGNDYFGELVGIDFRAHFSSWPREWQANAAGWLALRHEGGFTREVVSHWVYLTERLFGPVSLQHAHARFPGGDAAETHVHALAASDGVPFSIACSSGGTGPDLVEYTLWGTRASARIVDWNRLFTARQGAWRAEREDVADPREAGYERQLINAASAFADLPHTMPDFDAALSVQRVIEGMLEEG